MYNTLGSCSDALYRYFLLKIYKLAEKLLYRERREVLGLKK